MQRDKQKQKIAARRHYLKNIVKMKARAKAFDAQHKRKLQSYILSYLLSHPCLDCGEKNPIVLEFDHRIRSEKSFNVGTAVNNRLCLDRVIEEINKCDVRCANCHRKKTYKESGWTHRDFIGD